MKATKITILLLCILTLCYSTYYFLSNDKVEVEESLIFFPIDPDVQFIEATSNVYLLDQEDEDEYTIKFLSQSRLDRKAYLRQDLSFVFEDGILAATLSKWKENASTIKQKKEINGEDSSYYETVTFHHAEIHYPDDIIKSSQIMSYDFLYVIDSPLSPLEAFKIPETNLEREWKFILDNTRKQQLQYVWGKLLEASALNASDYYAMPLTALINYNDKTLPNLTKKQSQKAIGGLWEGIYKNYFLGIKEEDGSISSPIGSSLPLILLDKQSTHFIILFETKSGKNVKLIQKIG
ncbi:hypothetical protein CIB95_04740 [Lottiidibacillus patelloidae]|uniref:Uncharacterized protein n=1 Tax=Lottiidibacillus patelloidae TaxID=2670334 RepID=A0A263BVA7_9BACI|nr:hypothetical protein [Lottiidibacillus patelloidae]OZM57681.1 hypothetical protein CIB95_04740 [Lottiidibacillus patelloidae]